MWVPGHFGIRGNEAADTAAKEALGEDPADNLAPFSDLKSLTAKCIHQICQKEWDEPVVVSKQGFSSPVKPSMSSTKRRLVVALPPVLTVPS